MSSNPPSSQFPGEGFTPPLTLLGKHIRAFSRHVGFSLVAARRPRSCQGSPKGARSIRQRPQAEPIRAQRVPKRRPGMALGTPWDALGRPGATMAKMSSGNLFFRLKGRPDFGAPGLQISIIFAMNSRVEFCFLFDAVLAAKLVPKAPRGAKGQAKASLAGPCWLYF